MNGGLFLKRRGSGGRSQGQLRGELGLQAWPGSAVFGCLQCRESGESKGVDVGRAEEAQVRSGATTWSARQRRTEASPPWGTALSSVVSSGAGPGLPDS